MTFTFDARHLKLKHPFTGLVAGSTGCGKTRFVRQLMRHYRLLTTINEVALRVVYFHGQPQSLFDEPVADNVHIHYVYIREREDFDQAEDIIRRQAAKLVVVDDLQSELGGNESLAALFTRGSHHLGFSILFIVQNLFHRGKEVRTLSLNSHYLFAFKNARDRSQLDPLGRQVLPGNAPAFREMYADATREPYSYLLIDCTPDTPDAIRFRARITPEERVRGAHEHAVVAYQPVENARNRRQRHRF